ncbi:MAG: microtubule-binding protein [Pseudobdellovibrionaceae bacterium]|nr:microtubule-binding protein [Pseudobdellovibrionaceae bacterium]
MPFNYHKKHQDDQGHFWASYSDLLLGMGVVFLLLYVTASLTAGTSGIQAHLENQKLAREITDLRNQLKMYESVRDNYLNEQATPDEKELYIELLDKLTLLEEETKQGAERLKKAMHEQHKKQKALNKYQQLVRNLINANTFAKTQIAKREKVIESQDQEIEEQKSKIEGLHAQLEENQREKEAVMRQLRNQAQKLRQAYEQNQITEAQYQKRLAELKKQNADQLAKLEANANNLRGQLAQAEKTLDDLNKELIATKQIAKGLGDELSRTRSELGEKESKIADLKGKLGDAEKNVQRLQAELNARKKVAEDIKKAFAKKGIKAEVLGNGDVIIDFGEHHFDNDSARLKEEMKAIVRKAIPAYAQSLFTNKEITDKITSIEIVGFASPTYKGKFIDPNSSLKKDKEALAYNMDLSYRRAKSIYEYTFHNEDMKFPYQEKMLPLVKVSARSFLEMFDEKRRPSNFEEYCRKNDCNKARRVMIRFNIDTTK